MLASDYLSCVFLVSDVIMLIVPALSASTEEVNRMEGPLKRGLNQLLKGVV
jgi:hypothetical protein